MHAIAPMQNTASQCDQHTMPPRGAAQRDTAGWPLAWAVFVWLTIAGPSGWLALAGGETPPANSPAPEGEPAEREAQPAPSVQSAGFDADIQPIFAAHCLKCHGPDKRSGGLRLDAHIYVEAGGDSGKPILGGTLETNELYARVASYERTYRMPKNADPLSAQEIARIKAWVEQGTDWPVVDAPALPNPQHGWFLYRWTGDFFQFIDRNRFEYEFAWPYLVAFVAVQCALLVVLRAKAAYQKQRLWATGRGRWLGKFSSELRPRELLLAWLLVAVGTTFVVMYGHQLRLTRDLAAFEKLRQKERAVADLPTAPLRLDHPRQIAGTYYRGNCERNPQLFNNGNYLTAVFRIGLCDVDHKALQVGDPAPAGGVYLRMELERGPKTAKELFSPELMASVFLSPEFNETSEQPLREKPVRLETLEKDHRWVAYLRLGLPNAKGELDGLTYISTGRIEAASARGQAHYAIKHELRFRDGMLSEESDLWMNSFGNDNVAPPVPVGKIPYPEWFDFRPIPPITGENSTDPKLLGVEEYVKKGLIRAPAPPQSTLPRINAPPAKGPGADEPASAKPHTDE